MAVPGTHHSGGQGGLRRRSRAASVCLDPTNTEATAQGRATVPGHRCIQTENEVFQLPGAVGAHSPRPSVRQAVGHPQFVAGMAVVKSGLQLALGQAFLVVPRPALYQVKLMSAYKCVEHIGWQSKPALPRHNCENLTTLTG